MTDSTSTAAPASAPAPAPVTIPVSSTGIPAPAPTVAAPENPVDIFLKGDIEGFKHAIHDRVVAQVSKMVADPAIITGVPAPAPAPAPAPTSATTAPAAQVSSMSPPAK